MRRWRLANELRRLREAAGVTSKQAAERLCCSLSKISRIETASVAVSPRDVRDMLQLYRVSSEQQEALLRDADEARQKQIWWQEYDDVLDVRTRTFIGYEKSAASVRQYESRAILGLLQTKEYARVITKVTFPDLRDEQIERHVELRAARRSLLLGDNPPTLQVVLDEAALRRMASQRQVMRRQLQRLIEDAARPNVRLQLLPFEAGLHAGIAGPFTIIDFADPAVPALVHLEHSAGDVYLPRAGQISQFGALFAQLQVVALGDDESTAFLVELAGEL